MLVDGLDGGGGREGRAVDVRVGVVDGVRLRVLALLLGRVARISRSGRHILVESVMGVSNRVVRAGNQIVFTCFPSEDLVTHNMLCFFFSPPERSVPCLLRSEVVSSFIERSCTPALSVLWRLKVLIAHAKRE